MPVLSTAQQHHRFAAAFSVLDSAIAARTFPGAAFGVLYGGQVLALAGRGSFTYEQAAPAVTAGTVYDLASITKVMATTAMAMLLYQRGKLFLDQALVETLPDFLAGESADGPRSKVTLRLLLTHASGLPGYARLFEQFRDRAALLEGCLRLPLAYPPGSQMEYSDPGFILLGRALETIAGENLDCFCAREFYTPLGMTSTCFCPPIAQREAIPPTEEDATFRHRVIQGEVQDENCFILGGVAGHAGLFSNALDPLLFAECLLGGSEQRFTRETVELFSTRVASPQGSSRALGWDTPSHPSSSGKYFSSHSVGHLGFAGTSLWIDFDRKLAITLLTNRTWPDRSQQTIRRVRPAFHDAIMQALGEEHNTQDGT